MLALVWVLVGIGLTAAMIFGGISLFDGRSSTQLQVKETTTAMFQALVGGYRSYRAANDTPVTTSNWSTELVPHYVPELKVPVSGWTWTFNSTGNPYFCLYGSMSRSAYEGVAAAAAEFSSSVFFVNTTACGSNTNAVPGSYPATVYVNYYLVAP